MGSARLSLAKRTAVSAAAVLLVSCGGGGGEPVVGSSTVVSDGSVVDTAAVSKQGVTEYLQGLPTWDSFSPTKPNQLPAPAAKAKTNPERIDTVLASGALQSQQFNCTTTKFSMQSTPEKIVMFSPDRELLWPGALIQGRSHRDGTGSLLGLPIRERSAIKVSIPSLGGTNFRVVDDPDQATVSQAIADMVAGAPKAADGRSPSSIEFTLHDYASENEFALKAGMSGRYMGFSASASASADKQANERTVMVYFVEKMFEAMVEPPETASAFFSDAFTKAKLDEQVGLGRIGAQNLPVYVSNIVYGRMMAFTFTSKQSKADIQAALNAAYKGFANVSAEAQVKYRQILSDAKISITSIGGTSAATVKTIASGNWQDYFDGSVGVAPLSSAYPISYTFRSLSDGAIAKVTEATEYDIKECAPADGAGFILDSFEDTSTLWAPSKIGTLVNGPVAAKPVGAASAQSIFYGYEAVTHTNLSLSNTNWPFDVGFLYAPARTLGNRRDYYRGELSFWYKPDDTIYGQQAGTTQYCYTKWLLYFPPIWTTECVALPVALDAKEKLLDSDKVYVYDDKTTADQVVMRGGGTDKDGNLLTLTYNPRQKDRPMTQSWQKLTLSLSNDDTAGAYLCDEKEPDYPLGCWMVEDQIASEDQIQYVLENLKELRIRASYPVYRPKVCAVARDANGSCSKLTDIATPIPLGFVGGSFDEIKMVKPVR